MAQHQHDTREFKALPVHIHRKVLYHHLSIGDGGGGSNANHKKLTTLQSATPIFSHLSSSLFFPLVSLVLFPCQQKADKKNEERKLLSDVWGEVPQKQTTAIMGPSGAGKTSLLNILAGRAASRGRLQISADIRLNNYSVDPTNLDVRQQIAFVAQDDSLQVTQTPRESIKFSARLRLPRAVTDEQLDSLTARLLEELGLTSCADTIVGGALIKGISGGERKRTSVGVELVTKPALVFLDEPTSGLDSYSAVQLCQVLKKVANAGSSVLFTIHQPASEIFNSFDHLLLMNKGRVMYQGSVRDVPDYFAARGHPNPANYNPADWIMNVAQTVEIKQLDEDGFYPKDERPVTEAFKGDSAEGRDALGITRTGRQKSDDYDSAPVGMGVQISLLFKREIVNLRRDTSAFVVKMGITTFMAALVGIVFWGAGNTDLSVIINIQSHFGALVVVLLMGMFDTAEPALIAFPQERPIFLREYSTNHYSVASYFISRVTMEAVIIAIQAMVLVGITYFMIGFEAPFMYLWLISYVLSLVNTAIAVAMGCAVEDTKMAQELLPVVLVPQLLFAGFFVSPDLIPVWLRWAQ